MLCASVARAYVWMLSLHHGMKQFDVFGVASQMILIACASHGQHAHMAPHAAAYFVPALHCTVQI